MSELNNIQILEPKSQDMSFFIGSTNRITYYIKNNGEFKIKDLKLDTFTVKNTGSEEKPEYVNTEKNYARIVDYPNILMPYETKEIKVAVNVPPDYNETVYKNKEKHKVPFYVKFKVHGIEHIEEL